MTTPAADPTPQVVVTVFNGSFARTGVFTAPREFDFHLRPDKPSTGQFTVDADARYVAAASAPDARCTLDVDGVQYLAGPLEVADATGGPEGTVTFAVEDDRTQLTDMLGWMRPTLGIGSQGNSSAGAVEKDVVTGPAETVAKSFVSRNAGRLGLPWTVATDLARGDTVTVESRMDSLADVLWPTVTNAGVYLTTRQVGTGIVFDVDEPALYPITLTAQTGVVDDFSYSLRKPTGTRAVVAGAGEGVAREYAVVTDAALESLYRVTREFAVDARDVTAGDTATLTKRGTAALAERGPRTSLKVTLAERGNFRFPNVQHGDLVTTQLVPGSVPVTLWITEAHLQLTEQDGYRCDLIVGERTDDPDLELARAVMSVARAQRIAGQAL